MKLLLFLAFSLPAAATIFPTGACSGSTPLYSGDAYNLYRLTQDVTTSGVCFLIQSNSNQVEFDCNGYKVTSTGSSAYPFQILGNTNAVFVRNCDMTGTGMPMYGNYALTVENNIITNATTGTIRELQIYNSPGTYFHNNTLHKYLIWAIGSNYSVITNNTIDLNVNTTLALGCLALQDTSGATVEYNTCNGYSGSDNDYVVDDLIISICTSGTCLGNTVRFNTGDYVTDAVVEFSGKWYGGTYRGNNVDHLGAYGGYGYVIAGFAAFGASLEGVSLINNVGTARYATGFTKLFMVEGSEGNVFKDNYLQDNILLASHPSAYSCLGYDSACFNGAPFDDVSGNTLYGNFAPHCQSYSQFIRFQSGFGTGFTDTGGNYMQGHYVGGTFYYALSHTGILYANMNPACGPSYWPAIQ